MNIENELLQRSNSKCEICSANDNLEVYNVSSNSENDDTRVVLCSTCIGQVEQPERTDPNHWRCLNESMWSEVPAVKVLAWRMLHRLLGEGWPQDLLDMLYLDDETLAWAKSGMEDTSDEQPKHKDSNGTVLQTGDTVTLIKDLNVKGANFTAKRGTVVKGISIVEDNPEQIEGKVSGQQIVILTKFVKKAN